MKRLLTSFVAVIGLWSPWVGAFAQGRAEVAAAPVHAESPAQARTPAASSPATLSDRVTRAVEYRLSNGMTLIVKPDRRAPTVVHMLWVRVGSMDEVDGTSGVAHVLEHMMFKGTRTLAAGEFSRRVAAIGGRENAFTSRDYTGYYQQIPSSRLEAVMALEADRFAHMQWPDEEFARELEVVKEERRLRTEDNPRAQLFEQLNAGMWIASPYRRPIVGWMSDLDAMTAQDAREFHQRWYVPANAAVVVAGDVEPEQVRVMAERYYGTIAPRAVPSRKPREEPAQQGPRRIEYRAPAEQAYVSLAFKVPHLRTLDDAQADDALALTALSAVLSGYAGSRLDRALEQGPDRVADRAGAWYSLWGRGPQTFNLFGVPATGKTTAQVEAALREQIARVAREGISEAELQRVKTQWVASEIYKLDSVMNQARELGIYWTLGLPLDVGDRLIERLRAVTPAQVQSVAQRFFGDAQLNVATLVPLPMQRDGARRQAPAGLRH